MPIEDYGASFAPTGENALDAQRRAQIEGVPAAIKILSLRLPRFLGTKGLSPEELLTAQGARGEDPFASSVMQTIIRALAPDPASGGIGNPATRIIPGIEPTDPGRRPGIVPVDPDPLPDPIQTLPRQTPQRTPIPRGTRLPFTI